MALFGYLQLNPSQDILAVPIHAAFVDESEVVVQADSSISPLCRSSITGRLQTASSGPSSSLSWLASCEKDLQIGRPRFGPEPPTDGTGAERDPTVAATVGATKNGSGLREAPSLPVHQE